MLVNKKLLFCIMILSIFRLNCETIKVMGLNGKIGDITISENDNIDDIEEKISNLNFTWNGKRLPKQEQILLYIKAEQPGEIVKKAYINQELSSKNKTLKDFDIKLGKDDYMLVVKKSQ